MKILRQLIAALSLIVALTAAAAKPVLSVEPTTYNFGNIKENGGSVTTEFTLTNTGDTPLIIKDAQASCGCTHPTYSKEPIRPGESAKLKVTYSPLGRPGEFNKAVTIRSNAKNSKVIVHIVGTVIPKQQ
jgi:hypothetical protein